jgi:hypothetical protein
MTKCALKRRLFSSDRRISFTELYIQGPDDGIAVSRPAVTGTCAAGKDRHVGNLHRPQV